MYWLGWVIVLIGAILVFRLIVRRDYLINGKLSWFSSFLECLIFAALANLPYLYSSVPWPSLPGMPNNQFWSYISLGIIILGVLLVLGFMSYLGIMTALGLNVSTLRQTGPYQSSRNPQILAFYVVVLGFFFLYPSPESAAWVLLYGIISHIMIKTEEEHLLNVFGSSYQEYCSRVPRYFRIPKLEDKLSNNAEE
jgi:protein-S-isoprenylcysteine O-methyltransferase Ste14